MADRRTLTCHIGAKGSKHWDFVFNRQNFLSGAPKSFAIADRIHPARLPEAVSNLRKLGSEYRATDQNFAIQQKSSCSPLRRSGAHWYSAIASAQISLMRQFSGQGTSKRSQLAPPSTE